MNLKDLLDVAEDYQVPDALMTCMTDESRRNKLYLAFEAENMEEDFFREYFETNQADRKSFMQDYTPECVGEIVAKIVGETESVADVCSGTGALSVKVWNQNRTARFRCEELSTAALPFTLFNLGVRNVDGYVVHENALTREVMAVYELHRTEQHSSIACVDVDADRPVDTVISNPPYSMKWEDAEAYQYDERFTEFGIPPKSKADYGFVLHGYHKLKPGGTMVAILPHGVLFRGQKEGNIRGNLLKAGAIESVIGLPPNLFRNTGIPVVILVLKKGRQTKDVLFIDASRDFEKLKNINRLTDEQIQAIMDAYWSRKDIEGYAHLANYAEVEENDFNLNIPRYVDTYEPEEVPELDATMREIRNIHHEAMQTEGALYAMMKGLVGQTDDLDRELKAALKDFKVYMEERKKMEEYECTAVELHVDAPTKTRVADIADMERAKKGKKYPAGSTLIPMSAVNETDVPGYLEQEGEVDGRYAVVTFRVPCVPKYMWHMICGVFARYIHRYATGLNLQEDALKFLIIPVHSLKDQMDIVTEFDRQEKIMNAEAALIEKWESMKTTMLKLMFVELDKNAKANPETIKSKPEQNQLTLF